MKGYLYTGHLSPSKAKENWPANAIQMNKHGRTERESNGMGKVLPTFLHYGYLLAGRSFGESHFSVCGASRSVSEAIMYSQDDWLVSPIDWDGRRKEGRKEGKRLT